MATLSDIFKLNVAGIPPASATPSRYSSLTYNPAAPVVSPTPINWSGLGSLFSDAQARGQANIQSAQTKYSQRGSVGVLAPAVATTVAPVVAPATSGMTEEQRAKLRADGARLAALRGTTSAPASTSVFSPAPAPAPMVSTQVQEPVNPEYVKPDGTYYTAEEVVANRVAKLQAGQTNGAIPTYAGNTLTEGPQTTEQLQSTAASLNNARNDIATGEKDPYRAATQSGIAYSPQEMKAIESAYAGVYDPAINSALAKLDTKQKNDAAILKQKVDQENQVFNTNENIRQWRATTGTKAGATGDFSTANIHTGASRAGMTIDAFSQLDPDIQNHFVNQPYSQDPNDPLKKGPLMDIVLKQALAEVAAGTKTPESVAQEIVDSNLPEAVKQFYIDQIPLAPEKKNSFLDAIWNFITPL